MSESRSAPDNALNRASLVDLTLGAWRAREAAFQLAAQWRVRLAASIDDGTDDRVREPSGPEPLLAKRQGQRGDGAGTARPDLLGLDSREIDVAARGDALVMAAFDDAARLAPALPGAGLVAVLAPRYGLPLRSENEWFFIFLRRHGLAIALVGADVPTALGKSPFERRRGLTPPEVPAATSALSPEQRRILRFFPGLLPKPLAERLQLDPQALGLVPAGDTHFLIPPSWRDRDPRTAARDLDAMSSVDTADDGLRALAEMFCTTYFAEAQTLVVLSRKAEQAGSIDIARELAERARLVVRQPDDVVIAETRRVEVALAERRYADVAAIPEPSRRAAAEPKDRLRRLRTIGQVRAGALAAAERPLAVLLSRLEGSERLDADDLRLLADAAEARRATGDIGGAFTLAANIESALSRDPRHDRRIAFAAALTLARIHRLRGDIRDYRAAVARAYATSRGGRTLHDVIEMNVWETLGDRDPQTPLVRLAWLRAGLAWLAIEPSEGLARSAMLAILGKEVPRWQLDIDISDAIGHALDAAWPELAGATRQRFPVIRALPAATLGSQSPRAREDAMPRMMLAGEGAGVLWSPAGGSGVANARARQHLIRLVLAGLATLQPRVGTIDSGTLFVDSNLGIDIPRSRAEALTVALRHRAQDFVFAGDTITLDDDLRPRFAGDLTASIGPLVADIHDREDGSEITFHRQLPPRFLSPAEVRAIEPLRDRKGFVLSALAEHLGRSLAEAELLARGLEAARVIRLDAEPG